MPDFPQDIVDEVSGDNPASGEQRSQSVEESGNYEAAPEAEKSGDKPDLLTQDEQVVMHKISEAIAMLVYGEETNKPIIKLAMQGSLGVVYAVQMVMEKIRQTVKPGIPRNMIPLAAMAALTLIDDFVTRADPSAKINMREVVPMLIDRLGRMFEVSPAESVSLRRVKGKITRANMRDDQAGPIGQAMPAPDEAEPTQEPVEPANDEGAP